MSKGISLHIGINKVDDTHYRRTIFAGDGWDGLLKGCEADAKAMEALAKKQGFTTQLLLTESATRANVIQQIRSAAEKLQSGEYFFLTYSGHGSQVLDLYGDETIDAHPPNLKGDRRDETWCLHDAQLLDDELYELWSQFKAGVRILLFSDSCHSGTMSRNLSDASILPPEGAAFRFAPKGVLSATYKVHKAFYDGLQSKRERSKIGARVLLFSSCQDSELSLEDQTAEPPGGLFTKRLLNVWEPGKFKDYNSFFQQLKNEMYDDQQTPNLLVFGGDDIGFERVKPLELE